MEELLYIAAALLFMLGLKKMGRPDTAQKGNLLSSLGMFIAVVVTLFQKEIIQFEWILAGVLVGSGLGVFMARAVKMTSMPEMVALLNGFGGISSLLLALGIYFGGRESNLLVYVTTILSVFIGGLTFTGSLIAWGKLAEIFWSKAVTFPLQKYVNSLLLIACVLSMGLFVWAQNSGAPVFSMQADTYLYVALSLALVLGVLSVLSIGGGDMPVVISLLNSYSGLAACAAGFVIQNILLIVVGALVGASGIILTNIMCKAMNRSLANVLFSSFSSHTKTATQGTVEGEVKPISVEDSYYILEAARSAVIVPGYGMAVAQAQHAVSELVHTLEENGCEVRFAIHPVAGRMPGHMNVLLAEANVPYDQLVEMDDINPTMDTVDVCIVVGANDVVNPDAKENESSPIYGMPVIEVDKAQTVFVLKRSMGKGFAGIENPLFFKENTRMIFGDAKETLTNVVAQFKDTLVAG